jgi:hypothetical protein
MADANLKTTVEFPQSRCLAGVAQVDVTPPVGIYHRMWGAAKHDVATGVHRPLTATVLILTPHGESDSSAVFVALDHCLLWGEEMAAFLDAVSQQAKVDRDSIVTLFSHTHAAGLMGLERAELPGGEMIPPYLDELATKVAGAVRRASSESQAAVVSFATGRCDLGQNRDFFDEEAERFVCGFNPGGGADDSVPVARVDSAASGKTLATIVNYACHPTTLAWDNTLISPDYVGALRELVQTATEAPCLFIQGASGDIGPRDGYVGDVEVADRNGRQLGYAVLSALESLPANDPGSSGSKMAYTGAVISGATIGTWQTQAVGEKRATELAAWQYRETIVELPYREDLLTLEGLERDRTHWQAEEQKARDADDVAAAADARAMIERMTRRLVRVRDIPPGDKYPFRVRLWRLGDVVWVALEGEHYNVLQRRIRESFPDRTIIVATLANGSRCWYLPDESSYGKGLYQEDASILAKGSLETLTAAIVEEIAALS